MSATTAEKSAIDWLRESKGRRREKITRRRILEAAQANLEEGEFIGFCCNCGLEAEGCEPDARNYHCDDCGQNAVFGAEELLISVG